MIRNAHLWLPGVLRHRPAEAPPGATVHVLFCVADHFEPNVGGADAATQRRRVERWVTEYPRLARWHHDSDWKIPRPTFFYPAEAYQPDLVELLATLCREGFAEVEVQLHHHDDTDVTLAQKLEQAKADFARHGLLARDKATGQVRFGFVHGNWALNNSRPDGAWCGVNDELAVLQQAGCYADFTMPSAPHETQARKVNSLYYAAGDPTRPKSHDTGWDVRVGGQAPTPKDLAWGQGNGHLLLVQGSLALNWSRRKYGLLPRIENGEISAANPPTPRRADLWVRQAISVKGREEWVVVKVHTHGAREDNAAVLLGRPMDELWTYLETRYDDGARFRLHYVTARELVNIIRAAEQGLGGDPDCYRDYELTSALQHDGKSARPLCRTASGTTAKSVRHFSTRRLASGKVSDTFCLVAVAFRQSSAWHVSVAGVP